MTTGAHNGALATLTEPLVAVTIDGTEFDSTAMKWRMRVAAGPLTFDFENIPDVTDGLRLTIRDAVARMLMAAAPERTFRHLSKLRVFLKSVQALRGGGPTEVITLADFMNFVASLPAKRVYHARQMKEVLSSLLEVGFAGVDDDLRRALPTIETDRHDIGAAVRTMDPHKGPLTNVEYDAIVAALHAAFADGRLPLASYALALLGIVLGARPLQLGLLKVKDLLVGSQGVEKVYILKVARLKQGKGIRPRTFFRDRPLIPAVGEVLERQRDAAIAWATARGMEPDEAPMFPSDAGLDGDAGGSMAPGIEGHLTGQQASNRLSWVLKSLGVVSERTGQPIHLFQSRIRRTFGTRLAAEGRSAKAIAELMDHTWEASSLVYIETRPEMIERIDKALALKIAPMAQAFLGVVFEGGAEERKAASPGGVIHLATESALSSLGGCGKHDFCGLAAPLACYTCPLFNPWVDGPHEDLLGQLIAERDELLRVADERIASVNDRTILAVAEVVNRCRAALAWSEEG